MKRRTSLVGAGADDRLRELAAVQHGVVTRRQLLTAGVSRGIVDRRVAQGWLRPVYRGVYLVGPVTAPRAREMAAVLACGSSAVLSHRSAGALWLSAAAVREPGMPDVIARTGGRCVPGVRVHRISTILPNEITRLDGIPTTTPTRTVLDLASALEVVELERALAEAYARRLTSPTRLEAILARHPSAAGSKSLRAILRGGGPDRTRSQAESRFLRLVRDGRLGSPEANALVEGFEVDFYWRVERVVAEIDGFAYHSSPRSFERDRLRDATLAAAGLRVVRVTWRQLLDEPIAVAVRLGRMLSSDGNDGGTSSRVANRRTHAESRDADVDRSA